MGKTVICCMSARANKANAPWGLLMEKSKATWDSVAVDGMYTVFHVGAPEHPLEDRVIGFGIDEGLYNLGHRNLACYHYLLETDPAWEHMARINSSCYCSKPRLAKLCEGLPKTGAVVGAVVDGGDGNGRWMWGGTHYILSRDVVQAIVDNADRWDHSRMEDVAMSHLVFDLGFDAFGTPGSGAINVGESGMSFTSYLTGESFGFGDVSELRERTECCFIRVKQDHKRHLDLWLMDELFNKYDNRHGYSN